MGSVALTSSALQKGIVAAKAAARATNVFIVELAQNPPRIGIPLRSYLILNGYLVRQIILSDAHLHNPRDLFLSKFPL